MVSVHAFKRWNHGKAQYDYPKFKRTKEAIKACRGVLILGTEEKVHQYQLDWQGRYDPTRWESSRNEEGRGANG